MYNRFEIAVADKNTLAGACTNNTLLCTHFVQSGYLVSSVYPAIADRPGGGISIRVSKSIPNTAAFKAWLDAQYAAGTPIKAYYKFAVPTETPLNYADLKVKTYYPHTNIYTNATVQPALDGKFRLKTC